MLNYILVPIYVIDCLFLVGVVLLQQGKGADLAGAFGGGGSQTAFGARSATTLLHKATTWAFVMFIILSMSLSVLSARGGGDSVLEGVAATPAAEAPAEAGATTDADATESATDAVEPAADADADADGTTNDDAAADVAGDESAATEEAPAAEGDGGDDESK